MRRLHYPSNGSHQALPLGFFSQQLPLPGRGEAIVLGPLIFVRKLPFGRQPSLAFQAMQRRIQGPSLYLQEFSGTGSNLLADAVTVPRTPLQRGENEHIESPLQKFDTVLIRFLSRHVSCRHSTTIAIES